jgi:trigger factor
MKVTQEKLPASQIGLEIEITPELSKNAYERVIQKYTRTANIPGFRKGKVPRQILIQRLGQNYLKAMALDEAIQDSLKKVREREDIKAIGQFELRSEFEDLLKEFEPGKELAFKAKVDVPPEVKIENYTGLEIKAEEVKYDPAKVDEYLEEHRLKLATLVPV